MEFTLHEAHGEGYIEGAPGAELLRRGSDVMTVLEACFEHPVYRVLLYHENLPPHFFDLSSGEAGEILQKLRTYHVRFALVCPASLHLSDNFKALLIDERRGPYFRLFDERASAEEWLCSPFDG